MKNVLVFLNKINSFIWGTPTLLLIFFTGVILSLRTKFFQIRSFPRAFKNFFKNPQTKSQKNMTPFQSAATALSATMGTGNIVGVAGAIALGGPGAVFWMWVSAVFCMIIKFSEIALSVRYREQNKQGEYSGGAMYYIKNALPRFFSPLGKIFSVCGIIASFGVGNITQINTMSNSVDALFNICFGVSPRIGFYIKLATGIICALCCSIVLKNAGRIGGFCEKMIPLVSISYICMTLGAILVNYKNIPSAFFQIIVGAFNPRVVTGGVIGSMFIGMRFGMSRGVFSNEAGLGTAPIAYACADGDEMTLGLMGIMEVFIDTIIVCTLTALTILCTTDITYGVDLGANLTLNALSSVFGKNIIFVFCPVVCFFAFSSVIGWGLYGVKFISFLLGEKFKKIYLFIFVILMLPAAVFRADIVWVIAEIFNGLMITPNIIAILFLNNKIINIIYTYINKSTT